MVNNSLSIKREQNVRIVSPRSMTVVNGFLLWRSARFKMK